MNLFFPYSLSLKHFLSACVVLLALQSCGGGGGGGSSSSTAGTNSSGGGGGNGSALNCPRNWINVNNSCQCPATTSNVNGACVDQSGTVVVGGEFVRSGFPVEVDLNSGTYFEPVYVKVGNIDADPQPELIFKAGTSLIWAWKSDGSVVPGWPEIGSSPMHGKLVLGRFTTDSMLHTLIAHESWPGFPGYFDAFKSDATLASNWPVGIFDVRMAPVAGDLDGDGLDEVIYADNASLVVLNSLGQQVRSYLSSSPNATGWAGISLADLYGDGNKEIIAITTTTTDFSQPYSPSVRYLYVFNSDFTIRPGFPVQFMASYNFQPAIGDVDGDGVKEIVISAGASYSQFQATGALGHLLIVSPYGQLKSQIAFNQPISEGSGNYTRFDLEDLDNDGVPEILFYTGLDIQAYRGSGSSMPGWPVRAAGEPFIVGDIDGDQQRELITWHSSVMNNTPNEEGKMSLDIYDHQGVRKNIEVTVNYLGNGFMPAIADLDHNGRNQLILVGNYLPTFSGLYPQIWVLDFGGATFAKSGWNQMFGNAKNTGEYLVPQ